MFDQFGINAGFVEELHGRWQQSPTSVDEGWRQFFEGAGHPPSPAAAQGHANGNGVHGASAGNGTAKNGTATAIREAVRETVHAATEQQTRVAQLVNAYRVRGHLLRRPRSARHHPPPARPISSSRAWA